MAFISFDYPQVQFRLKQIVDAEPEAKENLLKELEEFAFRGIPDYQKTMIDFEGEAVTEEFEVEPYQHLLLETICLTL